jgi:hypothetical protein
MMTRLAARIALAFAIMALPAAGADKAATPSGTISSTALSPDGSLRAFTGYVSPFGPVDGGLMILVDPATGSFTGQFAFEAKGGMVFGTIEGSFTSASTYVERLTFTGGAGKYSKVSGYADVLGSLDLADGSGFDTVHGGQVGKR